jgi:WD40 repeat protein
MDNASARVWNAATGRVVKDFARPGTISHVYVAFSPDGRHLALSLNGEIRCHRTSDWEVEYAVLRSEPWLAGPVAYSPNGIFLAATLTPRGVALLRPADGRELAVLEHPDREPVMGVRFSSDGSQLLVRTTGKLLLWDLAAVRDRLAAMNLHGDLPTFSGRAARAVPMKGAPKTPLTVEFGG